MPNLPVRVPAADPAEESPEGFRGYRARVRCEMAGEASEARVAWPWRGRELSIDLELPAVHDVPRPRL